jgi:hypothetical protein
MTGPILFRGTIAAALLLAPSILLASPKSAGANGSATVLHPITLVKNQDMDFGILAAPAGGTAVLDPASSTVSTTGGVLALGGTPAAALFTGAASGGSVVNIKLPNQSVNLTRVGGTETIALSNFTLDGPSKRTMAKASSFQFHVGGTLTVAAGQVEGSYVGTFSVTAQYQ